MKQKDTFLAPVVLRSHLIDINLLLDYLIPALGENTSLNAYEIEGVQIVLIEIQEHIHAMFPDVFMMEKRLNTALSSLHSEN